MKRVIILPLLFLCFCLNAAPIAEQKAREIATAFFAANATRSSAIALELAWAGDDANSISTTRTRTTSEDALIYIYNRTDSDGFVIIAGDDSAPRPILAFSNKNTFDTQDVADGARMLLQGWCKQLETTKDSPSPASYSSTRAGSGKIVCEYNTALWGQNTPFNNESPTISGRKTIAGCVATALAILAYHYKWPKSGVGTTSQYTYSTSHVSEYTVPANQLGRTYQYDKMRNKYKGVSYTTEQGNAVAALMYDIGTSIGMKFDPEGSSPKFDRVKAMVNHFRYSKYTIYLQRDWFSDQEWFAMLKKNLDEVGPLLYHGLKADNSGGHSFVMEGYTDDGYFKINYGWNGSSNGFYLLDGLQYEIDHRALLYMSPDKDGTSQYQDILAFRVFTGSSSGIAYKGVHTNATNYKSGQEFKVYIGINNIGAVDFSGQLGIAHCDKDGVIKRIVSSKNITRAVGSTNGYTFLISISPTDIATGDKLMVVYKGAYSSDWQKVTIGPKDACKEVLLCATPEQVAESLKLKYDKTSKQLTFSSENAIQFAISDSDGSELVSVEQPSHTDASISLSSYKQGEYRLSFAGSGEPYLLNVVF